MPDFRTTLHRIKNLASLLDREILEAFDQPQTKAKLEALFDRVRASVSTLSQEAGSLPGAPTPAPAPHRPLDAILSDVNAAMQRTGAPGTIWEHVSGKQYRLTGFPITEETGEVRIAYSADLHDHVPMIEWTRTPDAFLSRFKRIS